MIRPTTLRGAKDILLRYGSRYCIIYELLEGSLGYWLVEIENVEVCEAYNEWEASRTRSYCVDGYHYTTNHIFQSPSAVAYIPGFIMGRLVDEGLVVKSISDKEWRVQIALGTAPFYRQYLILEEEEA